MGLSVRWLPLGDNTVYAVDGPDGRVVVDAGPDFAGAWESVVAFVPAAAVAVTHGHVDHAGLGRRWQEAGVPVYLHPLDAHLVGSLVPKDAGWSVLVDFVRRCGAPGDVVSTVLAGLERRRMMAARWAAVPGYPPATQGSRHPTGLRYDPFSPMPYPDGPLPNGLEWWHLPGHTPGTVVLVARREGWVFSGDLLLPNLTPTPGVQLDPGGGGLRRFRSLPRFVDALREVRKAGFARCFPGHGEPFDQVERAIDATLNTVEARAERLRSDLRALGRATPYELAIRSYPRALARRFWQVLPVIQGSLDLLEERGLVRREDGAYVPVF